MAFSGIGILLELQGTLYQLYIVVLKGKLNHISKLAKLSSFLFLEAENCEVYFLLPYLLHGAVTFPVDKYF